MHAPNSCVVVACRFMREQIFLEAELVRLKAERKVQKQTKNQLEMETMTMNIQLEQCNLKEKFLVCDYRVTIKGLPAERLRVLNHTMVHKKVRRLPSAGSRARMHTFDALLLHHTHRCSFVRPNVAPWGFCLAPGSPPTRFNPRLCVPNVATCLPSCCFGTNSAGLGRFPHLSGHHHGRLQVRTPFRGRQRSRTGGLGHVEGGLCR